MGKNQPILPPKDPFFNKKRPKCIKTAEDAEGEE